MDNVTRCGIFMGIGFLLGTLGVKAITSDAARKYAVKGIAAGMRAKQGYEGLIEQARAEVGDIVAEASYLNKMQDEAAATQNSSDDNPAQTTEN